MIRRLAPLALSAFVLAFGCNSSSDKKATPAADAAPGNGTSAWDAVPVTETLKGAGLGGRVEVVRDDFGIPHIHAATSTDAMYAQGYVMASDRFVQMDLGRRQASGTLGELFGSLLPSVLDSDIQYRTHHLRKNAEQTWQQLSASTDPVDQKIVAALKSFTAGVNAWVADLKAGKRTLPSLEPFYTASTVTEWSEVDSLALGDLQAFALAFDADTELWYTAVEEGEAKTFVGSADAAKAARVGFASDYLRFAPVDPTTTVAGWDNAKLASLRGAKPARRAKKSSDAQALALRDARSLKGFGRDRLYDPTRGSNNWVVAGKLTESGQPMVANDTHLSLDQPAIFYLCHVTADDGLDVMGVQFPGIPLVILGMNRHVAWGGTVSNVDATDVYLENIKACADGQGQCVTFKGQEVKLVPRVETINVGQAGSISQTKEYTLYDVPHHGPIIMPSRNGVLEPLGATAHSVRYVGHEPAPLIRAVYGLATSKNVDEARAALERDFAYGGQNWVMADDSGNILWTQAAKLPHRAKGTTPWKVMPGDGSAEWQGFFASSAMPAAKNPESGFFATANADPVGVTLDNDPMNEPDLEGFPRYIGAYYDNGTRVGRITQRIKDAVAAGKKLTRDDMASIQADATTYYGKAMRDAFNAGAKSLQEEIAMPGTHAEIASIVAGMSTEAKAAIAPALEALAAWSFDTPAGNDGESAEQLRDSRAALVHAVFTTKLTGAVLGDELDAIAAPRVGSAPLKMLHTMLVNPTALKTTDKVWDDLTTAESETKAFMLAKGVALALDWIVKSPALGASPDTWRWGRIHRVVSEFPLPSDLNQPPTPRHGGDGTVDVAGHGTADDVYDYSHGAAIRFVAQLDPAKGPLARNVTPGGQIFLKESPHFGDLFALWAKNEAIDLAYRNEEIIPRAQAEHTKNGLGRMVFEP